MPIIQVHPGETTTAIWRIEEPEAWFLERLQLSPTEQAQFEPIQGWRRLEWLAVRQLVAEITPGPTRSQLIKDECGKPYLHNSALHVSISHSHQLAAAMVGPPMLGIDIQLVVEKIVRLAPRFLSPSELAFIRSDAQKIEQLHVCWCAKEALYKAYGQKEIDFRAHLLLEPFDYQSTGGQFRGMIKKGNYQAAYTLQYGLVAQEYMLVSAMLD